MNNKEQYLFGDRTCVLVKNNAETYISTERGIKPMIGFISDGINLNDYQAYDLIVGKAAALLFVYAGISYVYGEVMSTSAVDVLTKYHIQYEYGTLADKIINRRGDDICPMEKATLDVGDPKEAYLLLKEKVQNMAK